MRIFWLLATLVFATDVDGFCLSEYGTIYPDLVWMSTLTGAEHTLLSPGYAGQVHKSDFPEISPSAVILKNQVIVLSPFPEGVVGILELSKIKTDSFGYSYISALKEVKFDDGSFNNQYVIIRGGGWLYWDDYRQPDTKHYYFLTQILADVRAKKYRADVGIVDDGIKKIGASSELREGAVIYSSLGMRHPFLMQTYDSYGVQLNHEYPPWAEGEPGSGIGSTIDIEFTRPTKEIDVLNGYVDLAKRNLYKENNRLKTIQVDSETPKFTISYTFEDVVKFHEVPLPMATTRVRITITDVYKGTKYDDTCVTKIFIPQRELRPRSEYEAEIEKILRQVGYLK